jgi:hypothetical protein
VNTHRAMLAFRRRPKRLVFAVIGPKLKILLPRIATPCFLEAPRV